MKRDTFITMMLQIDKRRTHRINKLHTMQDELDFIRSDASEFLFMELRDYLNIELFYDQHDKEFLKNIDTAIKHLTLIKKKYGIILKFKK